MLKAKDILKFEIKPFLYGVMFSRIMPVPDGTIPEKFYLYSSFKRSKAVLKTDFSFKNYAKVLVQKYNNFSGYENWEIYKVDENKVEIRFSFINDLNIDSISFFDLVYKKLLSESWLYSEFLTEEKKSFIRGFMEPRGSVDTSLKLIAQDYFYNNLTELKRVLILTDTMNIPIPYANFNSRNLQPQFVTGENRRNAQFRINLPYYASNIGFINEYKAKICKNAYKPRNELVQDGVIYYEMNIPSVSDNIQFIKYLNFFTNNIYNKLITKEKVDILREKLGFNYTLSSESRNRSIIELFDDISEDKCALCGTTKTFTKKSNGRQAFEIHHMIPYHNGKQFDNIANLVKLCPTCHRSFKRGNATREEQLKNIINILHKQRVVYEFTSLALGIEDLVELSEEIWKLLG